jgi:hypothetical protein
MCQQASGVRDARTRVRKNPPQLAVGLIFFFNFHMALFDAHR